MVQEADGTVLRYARQMRVRVLLFGVLKERLGGSSRVLDLGTGATVADVIGWAAREIGDGRLLASLAVAVNREYAARGDTLSEGDEVALLPPVSGGAA